MPQPETITQEHYPRIDIDNSEPDVVTIYMQSKDDPQVLFIERERLQEFISILTKIK